MDLKLLANQVFLRTERERSNERPVNAGEKERSFPKVRMNAEMNAKPPDPSPPDLGPPLVLVAAWWLEDNLTQPRRVGEICAQWTGGTQRLQRNGSLRWEGGRDGIDGHWITDLCKAREPLGIEAFIGADGLFWWTCPRSTCWDLMMTYGSAQLARWMKAA